MQTTIEDLMSALDAEAAHIRFCQDAQDEMAFQTAQVRKWARYNTLALSPAGHARVVTWLARLQAEQGRYDDGLAEAWK